MHRPVFVTSLLLSGLCLAACSNGQPAGPTSSPHCGDDPYSTEKADARLVTLPRAPPPASGDYGADGILIVDHPLGLPPEIARIRRGLTFHFVGGFINDGRENWQAVDLDAKIVVSIARRNFSRGAKLTRPFGDPVFPPWASKTTPPALYARKWSNDQGSSEEVIGIAALPSDAEEAFVCTANAVWAVPADTKPLPIPTDTVIYNASLLDFDATTQKQYAKDVPIGSALNWVMRNLPAPVKYEWPLTQRR